jgi:4-hydroxy-4-methyl-2-oxoglutarate aldolase
MKASPHLTTNREVSSAFAELSTPLLADACVRLKVPLRIAPPGVRPVTATAKSRLAGRVLPVRHYGSVDIFLEALENGQPGDVLVVDNGGRTDEGCVGDLTALETQACGLAGIIIWGCHRDTAELIEIGFPIFSYGICLAGPLRIDGRDQDAFTSAHFGDAIVTKEDVVFADADGVLFVSGGKAENVIATAKSIFQREREQAREIQRGRKVREQLRFDEYLARRSADSNYTLRKHLRAIGGAIEE